MDRGKFAFMYLAAMFTIETFVWGFATSFGVLFNFYRQDSRSPLPRKSEDTRVILSMVGTINIGIMASTAPFLSLWIAKRPDTRRGLMLFGVFTCGISLLLSSFSTSALHVLLTQGISYSIGGGALYSSAISYLPEWFEARRGLANGIVFAGTGAGGLIFPLLLNTLLSKYGVEITLRIAAAIITAVTLLAVFCVQPRITHFPQTKKSLDEGSSGGGKHTPSGVRSVCKDFGQCLTWVFCTYLISNTYQSTVFYLPGVYLPTYSECLGLPAVTGSALVSLLNAGSVISQLGGGILSDYYSPHLIGLLSNLFGGASVLVFWGALGHHGAAGLFVFSATYGCTAGAWTSLFFSVLRDFITNRELVIVGYGVLSFTRGMGNIAGGPISSALVSSSATGQPQCGGFPTGPFARLIWFVGLVLATNTLIEGFLWLYFRRHSRALKASINEWLDDASQKIQGNNQLP